MSFLSTIALSSTRLTFSAIARDRLLHIAVMLQMEIIKSLQMAAKHETAILNLQILHETSIMNRKETFVTLDEMKHRIMMTRPVARQGEVHQLQPFHYHGPVPSILPALFLRATCHQPLPLYHKQSRGSHGPDCPTVYR